MTSFISKYKGLHCGGKEPLMLHLAFNDLPGLSAAQESVYKNFLKGPLKFFNMEYLPVLTSLQQAFLFLYVWQQNSFAVLTNFV